MISFVEGSNHLRIFMKIWHHLLKVLAHRGQYWTLLQNSARALWNCLHTAMQRAVTLAPEGQDQPGLLTVARLNEVVWHPVHMATDCLLDMLFLLESEQKQYTIKVCIPVHVHFTSRKNLERYVVVSFLIVSLILRDNEERCLVCICMGFL